MSEKRFINYEEVLKRLENTNDENNLLLGNGFNTSLGVDTSYENIFEKMKEECSLYGEFSRDDECDIEKIIGILRGKTKDEFLQKFVSTKIKLDFMKAANKIVRDSIKNIYQENKEGIYLLLRNFIHYFSLNYDPLLYLLLMKYKKPEQSKNSEQTILLFSNTVKYKEFDLTEEEKGIYEEIKSDYENGKITFQDNTVVEIGALTKSKFQTTVQLHFEGKGKQVTDKILKKLSNLLWEEKKEKQENLISYDGFFHDDLFETKEEKETKYVASNIQNVFFLHGTFYFYQTEKGIFKIISKHNKALYERLEDIISDNNEDIICVFKDENKLDEINKNDYLKTGYKKLSTLRGSLVIIGCSLSENDEHIFKQIEASAIDTIYISSMADKEKQDLIMQDYEKAKKYFTKEVVLFDPMSISYKKTKEPQVTQ